MSQIKSKFLESGAVTNDKLSTGIDAAKIGDGSVTNAEFQFIGGLTGDAQTQITGKIPKTGASDLSGTFEPSTPGGASLGVTNKFTQVRSTGLKVTNIIDDAAGLNITNNSAGNDLVLTALKGITLDGQSDGVYFWSDVTMQTGRRIFGLVAPTGNGQPLRYNELGAVNGICTLDGSGKVPASMLPNSVMEFKGMFDASLGSPALVNGTGNAGDVYKVSVGGSYNFGAGAIVLVAGDFVMYSGTVWEKSASGAGGDFMSSGAVPMAGSLNMNSNNIINAATISAPSTGILLMQSSGAGGDTTVKSVNGAVNLEANDVATGTIYQWGHQQVYIGSAVELFIDAPLIKPSVDNATDIGSTANKMKDVWCYKVKGLSAPSANGEALRYDELGVANGIATLDGSGTLTSSQLPASAQTTFAKETFVLSAGDITNQYLDITQVAKTGSVMMVIKGGAPTLEGASYDYSLAYTGGAGGKTRLSFLNDIATGGASPLVAGDVVQICYAY